MWGVDAEEGKKKRAEHCACAHTHDRPPGCARGQRGAMAVYMFFATAKKLREDADDSARAREWVGG